MELYNECGKKKDKLEEATDLFGKLIKNIIDNPNEDKFRTFRKVILVLLFFYRKTLKLKRN